MKTLALFSSLLMAAIPSFGQTNVSPTHYIHVGTGRGTNATVLLCTPTRFGEPIIVTNGVTSCELSGIIQVRGTGLVVNVAWKSPSGYSAGSTFASYRGNATVGEPVFPGQVGGIHDSSTAASWFIVSTNLDNRSALEALKRLENEKQASEKSQ